MCNALSTVTQRVTQKVTYIFKTETFALASREKVRCFKTDDATLKLAMTFIGSAVALTFKSKTEVLWQSGVA